MENSNPQNTNLEMETDSPNGFRRSGKLQKSPTQTPKPEVPTMTPKATVKSVAEVTPDEKNMVMAITTVDVELSRMDEVLRDMRVATAKQKNIPLDVKKE